MAQSPLHVGRMHSACEQERREGVPEIMEAYLCQPYTLEERLKRTLRDLL